MRRSKAWASITARVREQGVDLEYDETAIRYLSEKGSDEQYGARPLRRLIQRTVEDALSERLLSGEIHLGDRVRVRAEDGALKYERPEDGA